MSKFEFKPKLFLDLRNYSKEKLTADIMAGIIVGIVALPLAIAFGIASGVTPEKGIITAIIAGMAVSLFGGSRVQIGGPTGAFIVIIYGIIQQYGETGLLVATVMAGVFLILLGIFHLGTIIKFIPYPIVVGFTAGIALTIFSTQMPDFFGLSIDEKIPGDFIGKWGVYFRHFASIDLTTTLIGLVSILLIVGAPRISSRLPGALVAIVVMTLAVWVLNQFGYCSEVETIGKRFRDLTTDIPHPHSIGLNMESINLLLPSAFTIAVLGAIESLLSATVADGVTGSRTNSNTELIGQGIANIAVPFFGGIPVTGAIARTMTNITNGGRTPVAGIIHAMVLLMAYLFLMPLINLVPMACLGAVLIVVAYNMSGWRTVVKVVRHSPKSDVAVLIVTFLLTVVFDLVVAIVVGLSLACLLFMKRMADVAVVKEWEYIEDTGDSQGRLKPVPTHVMVYEISGPMFFGAADKIPHMERNTGRDVLILRMRSVPAMDITALNSLHRLYEECRDKGIKVIFSHVNEQPLSVFQKSGMYEQVGEENFAPNIDAALARAAELEAGCRG